MKSSPRDLELVRRNNLKFDKKTRRYFSIKTALRRSIHDLIEHGVVTTIYDHDKGVDVLTVYRGTSTAVLIKPHSPRRFNFLWRRG